WGVNPTVAALGVANIVLYAGVYTPLKRRSVINTWVGAIVGAIPPLMGWAAAAGSCTPALLPPAGSSSTLAAFVDESARLLAHPGGWLLATLLFAWQFPHFNALSHTIAHEYKRAGYRMLASVDARMNARIALRYSILMFPVCFGLTACGVT